MYILNPDFTQKSKMQKDAYKGVPLQEGNACFAGVLSNVLQHQVIESSDSLLDKNMRKKKKDSKEILDDYSEEKKELHDVLETEKKIRQIFRKIRLDETV